jgi:site-specific DNA-methyltransferase (adenine-specific)
MEDNSIINPELYYKIKSKNTKIDTKIIDFKMTEKKYINEITVGDCREVMAQIPTDCIDLIVTSPPYGVGIEYDVHNDDMIIDEYLKFTEEWLTEAYKVLKDDGRIALNIPYEINRQDKGGRVFVVSEIWQIMKKIGFKFFGIVDLEEDSPHRSRTTAWGSWMSPSAPYIYNPKECVILAYKKTHVKKIKGTPQWIGEAAQVPDKNNPAIFKNKTVYRDEDKKEFMELVFGQWKYFNDSRPLTKATFSMDIPSKAIKILSYKGDVIMDPFMGSGTTALSAEFLGRNWIGIELSEEYTKVAKQRILEYRAKLAQTKLELEEVSKF